VIHAALPGSVEAYYQEIGRAGRDGLESRAILLHNFADRKIHESFFERDYPPVEDLDKVARALTGDFQEADTLALRLNLDPDTVGRAVEKLAAQGAAQFDMEGQVRASGAAGWRVGYKAQLAHRRAQLDHMIQFAETPQCRMAALVRHFGDRAGRPCGRCDFCAPQAAVGRKYEEPSGAEERDLRAILDTVQTSRSMAAGRLFTEAAVGKDRRVFDRLLDGLARAGLVTLASENWVNPEGREVTYKRVNLTEEGRRVGAGNPLGVLLPSPGEAKARTRRERTAANGNQKQTQGPSPARAGLRMTTREETRIVEAAFNEGQVELESRLRAWRKAEAAQAGKPAFFVFSDAILRALVVAAPRTIPQLRSVRGIGPQKAEQYGAAICALCRGE
jgi:ATP-dependent DNA helicase RecQ